MLKLIFRFSGSVTSTSLIHSLNEAEPLNPQLVAYLNRLSDHLFVAARFVAAQQGGDVLWQPGATRG